MNEKTVDTMLHGNMKGWENFDSVVLYCDGLEKIRYAFMLKATNLDGLFHMNRETYIHSIVSTGRYMKDCGNLSLDDYANMVVISIMEW